MKQQDVIYGEPGRPPGLLFVIGLVSLCPSSASPYLSRHFPLIPLAFKTLPVIP